MLSSILKIRERYIVLADLYLENRQRDKAVETLTLGIKINPDAQNIIDKLTEINK